MVATLLLFFQRQLAIPITSVMILWLLAEESYQLTSSSVDLWRVQTYEVQNGTDFNLKSLSWCDSFPPVLFQVTLPHFCKIFKHFPYQWYPFLEIWAHMYCFLPIPFLYFVDFHFNHFFFRHFISPAVRCLVMHIVKWIIFITISFLYFSFPDCNILLSQGSILY